MFRHIQVFLRSEEITLEDLVAKLIAEFIPSNINNSTELRELNYRLILFSDVVRCVETEDGCFAFRGAFKFKIKAEEFQGQDVQGIRWSSI